MNESEAVNEYLEREWRELLEYWSKNSKNDTGRELEKLLKAIELATRPKSKKYVKKNKEKAYYNPAYSTSFYNSYKQLCVVKCSYVLNSKIKHKNFLRNYITQEDKPQVKNKPHLFNETEDIVSEKTLTDYELYEMDKFFFRFIISPKRQDVPLQDLIRIFMKTVEDMTGYQLEWFAAPHYDTLNQHGHILINGHDKNGKKVRFPKAYFRSLFREISRDICTGLVGYRTDYDIKQDREDQLSLTQWTRMDINIDNSKIQNNYCDAEYPFYVTSQNSRMHKRLLFLAKIECAKKIGSGEYPGKFLLQKDWKDKLRYGVEYDTYLSLKKQFWKNEKVELQLYKRGVTEIEGRVTRIVSETYDCEDHNGIIIDASDGTKWYFPLRQELSRSWLYQKVKISREGKLISREKSPASQVQNVIQQNTNKTVKKPDKSYNIGRT